MMNRHQIEAMLENFGHTLVRRKWIFLILMLAISLGLISQLPNITMDTSNEGFLHENDPTLITYNKFREQFGREEMIMLSIDTPNLFTLATLEKIRALHHDLENKLPHLDEVSSIINARNTRGSADELIVEDLFEHWPTDQQALETIKQIAINSSTYENFLLSKDATLTTILIKSQAFIGEVIEDDLLAGFDEMTESKSKPNQPIGDKENSELVAAVKQIVDEYQADDFRIYAAGTPTVIDQLKKSMKHDMQTFTKYALITIILVLAFMFRRLSGVLLPLSVVVLTLLSTLGLMAATGTALKLPTQILPSLILAVSVAASVHLLAIFYQHFHREQHKENAIAHALGHSGLAIIMTSLTTAAGLLSFAASEVSPIADLGRFAGAGVLLSLLYTLILLPTLIAIFPIKHKGNKTETANHPFMDKLLSWTARFSVEHPKTIVVTSLLLFAIAFASLLNIEFRHDPLEWMPEHWEIRQATKLIDEKMRGSSTMEVIIDTQKENGLYDPIVMHKINEVQTMLQDQTYKHSFIGKTVSVVDIVKESNRALHENREEFYKVPDNRDLIAQELFLFENSGSDDLEDFVDSQFSQARLTLKGPWVDAGTSAGFIRQVMTQIQQEFSGLAETTITGMGSLFVRTLDTAINSTRTSYLVAAVVITLMMIILLGELKLGLISMIPNLLPIVIALGVLAAIKIPLDMFTMLVGSIAIGLAVDDTIHFMHNFKRYFHQTGDVKLAVEKTLHTTGRAIVVTTIVLCLGFFIFMAATMNNVFRFGALTGSTILLALVADLLLAPALMMLLYGRKQKIAQN